MRMWQVISKTLHAKSKSNKNYERLHLQQQVEMIERI